MKPITKLFFILALLSFIISSCEDSPSLVFNGVKSKTAKHLGEGVWFDVPTFYKKAKSYNGYQVSNYESSISLEVKYESISDVKKAFDKDMLSRKKTKLLALEVVKFGAADSAVYAKVYDKRKQIIRHLLSIKKDNKMYKVKIFYQKQLKDKYEKIIERALESVAFGDVVEKKEAFIIAELTSLSDYILTRDGLFPTEAEDEAVIRVKTIDVDDVGTSREYKIDFLQKEVKKYNSTSEYYTNVTRVGEGHYLTIKFEEGENKVFGAYLTDGLETSILFIGTSNSREGINEIADFVKFKNIKTVLDVR